MSKDQRTRPELPVLPSESNPQLISPERIPEEPAEETKKEEEQPEASEQHRQIERSFNAGYSPSAFANDANRRSCSG